MRPSALALTVFACFVGLILFCFWDVLAKDRSFGYRDAAHYYYPLYKRVQTEWQAGRWPLWEPEENAGMPIVGNPTAAVFYPAKLVYAVLSYDQANRVYAIVHMVIALCAMLILMRGWGVSLTGSALAALAYAFGAPILFQYCNIIYLVGAAWLPLGFHAVDWWVRRGNRWGLLELAVVLALQTLGGDPQVCYLLGLCGAGYAAGLAWARARMPRPDIAQTLEGPRGNPLLWAILVAIAIVAVWFIATVALAIALPSYRPRLPKIPPAPLPWMPWVPPTVMALWALGGLAFLLYWKRSRWRNRLAITWLGLALSAILAMTLSAVQLFPVLEFTQQTARAAATGPHDIYPFSIEPYRLLETFWPNIFGTHFGEQSYWLDSFKLPGMRPPKIWVPSLYVGALTLVLALGSMSLWRGTAREVWMTLIVIFSVICSLGQYTSPIWITRAAVEGTASPALEGIGKSLGPIDPIDATPIRLDRVLRDGDGSVYWWMTNILPGFRQFRYPGKLFTFSCLGITVLAGFGWDHVLNGRRRRIVRVAATGLLLSLTVLAVYEWKRPLFITAIQNAKQSTMFGPVNTNAACRIIELSLLQSLLVLGLGLTAVWTARRNAQLAGIIVLVVMSIDLAAANARYVISVPQSLFESKPEVARLIEEAEKKDPSPGPFRVHRMPVWNPIGWSTTNAADRIENVVEWEHRTIQPKYGITEGIEYTHTMGVAELYDYEWFFNGFPRIVHTPEVAKVLGVDVGTSVIYFPRRSVDLWNTRYIVTPSFPNRWTDEQRGYAAYLPKTDVIYPASSQFEGPDKDKLTRAWAETNDFQILKNHEQYPRAWVVHEARAHKLIEGMSRDDRVNVMEEIIYNEDFLWRDSDRRFYDAHTLAWIEDSDRDELRSYTRRATTSPSERVTVTYPDPQHVELRATLEQPGLVVLSDIYYPGWELTIDGVPAKIYRVNRLMRGAAVAKGAHTLLYSYRPRSFRIGGIVSLASLGVLLGLCLLFMARTRGAANLSIRAIEKTPGDGAP